MALSCEEDWKNYKEVVKSSSVRCLEVVVKKGMWMIMSMW
jgi:hypothetical protein